MLLVCGVCEIFGIFGDFVLLLFCEIECDGCLLILILVYEFGVGFVVDVMVCVCGGLGVVVVIYGVGVFNMVNVVVGVYVECVLLVVLFGVFVVYEVVSGLLLYY